MRSFSHSFSIEIYFSFFFFDQETRLADGLTVLLFVTTLHFAEGLAIKNELVPGFVLFEDIKYIFVLERMVRRGEYKSSHFQAIVFEDLLQIICDTKSFDTFIIFEFKGSFGSAILNYTKNLDIKYW